MYVRACACVPQHLCEHGAITTVDRLEAMSQQCCKWKVHREALKPHRAWISDAIGGVTRDGGAVSGGTRIAQGGSRALNTCAPALEPSTRVPLLEEVKTKKKKTRGENRKWGKQEM